MHAYHNVMVHSSADRHLGWFHFLAIVNKATMDTGVQLYLQKIKSFGSMFRMSIALPCDRSIDSHSGYTNRLRIISYWKDTLVAPIVERLTVGEIQNQDPGVQDGP